MDRVTVITPSRIHIALIDLNGQIGKVDGSVGLSLSEPGFKITVRKSDRTQISCDEAVYQRALEIINLVQDKCKIGDAEILIENVIPPHVGLGSGTQLALGLGTALCKLYDLDLSPSKIAFIAGRGGTSGIGVAAFSSGGFIVDGGHKYSSIMEGRKDVDKTCFLPSSASRGVKPPPVIARYDFPNWDVLITIPNCKRISGEEEVKLFQDLCPLPIGDVMAIAHLVLLKMMPAVLQRDLNYFGESIDAIQGLGWKKVEIEKQDPIVRQTMDFLRRNGAKGVGMSSWGPTIFCFGEDLSYLYSMTKDFLSRNDPQGTCFITHANNTGAKVIID